MNKERNPEQRSAVNRTDRLEEARGLGLQGYYDSAIEMIEDLLKDASADVESLRLKGNLLELKAMEVAEISRKKLTTSADYLTARQCYERILEIDPRDAAAHIDLGDHYRNLEANDKALEYYRGAAGVLRQTPNGRAWKEDVEELLKAAALLTEHERVAQEARSIEAWCSQALSTPD